VLDFGVVKEHAVKLCKAWNEHFICPMNSDVLDIKRGDGRIEITCEDGAYFVFPEVDCLCLPIVHSTAEELAIVFTDLLIKSLTLEYLEERKITEFKVSVGETINQQAIYRLKLKDYPEIVHAARSKATPCLDCATDGQGGADAVSLK